jgi:DNA-binding CsgD family transcriptional regulator
MNASRDKPSGAAESREVWPQPIRSCGIGAALRCPLSAESTNGHSVSSTPYLSTREKEVLIAWLKTDSKIAVGQSLFITASTVRTHIQRIREKYEAVGRPAPTKSALTVRAIQDGFITVDDL